MTNRAELERKHLRMIKDGNKEMKEEVSKSSEKPKWIIDPFMKSKNDKGENGS